MQYLTFGKALKAYRERRAEQSNSGEFRQKDLAKELIEGGYQFSTDKPVKLISEWETDKRFPSYRVVMEVALALNMTIDELRTNSPKKAHDIQRATGLSGNAVHALECIKKNSGSESHWSTIRSFVEALLCDYGFLSAIGIYFDSAIKSLSIIYPHITRDQQKDRNTYRDNALIDFWPTSQGTPPDEKYDVCMYRASELISSFTKKFIHEEAKKRAEKE